MVSFQPISFALLWSWCVWFGVTDKVQAAAAKEQKHASDKQQTLKHSVPSTFSEASRLEAALEECLGSKKALKKEKARMEKLDLNPTAEDCVDQSLKACLAQKFIEEQFKNWKEQNCGAFLDSFSDDLQYCDVTPPADNPCTSNKDFVKALCSAPVYVLKESDLVVKPRRWPKVFPSGQNSTRTCEFAPLYDNVVATGIQSVYFPPSGGSGKGSYFCADFAINQNLVWEEGATTTDQVKSSEWKGYYTWTPGKCGFTARRGILARLRLLLIDLLGATQPVHEQDLAARTSPNKMPKKLAYVGVAVVFIAAAASLGYGLGYKKGKESVSTAVEDVVVVATESPTASPTRPLPPMDLLELLYEDLPDQTRESLYDSSSPQYLAWEWLLNHPNITNLEEWRKKQIFALSTFFYSFEGPLWPEQLRNNWMDVNSSECSWILNEDEIEYWTGASYLYFGPAYDEADYHPCNELGELQTIVLHPLSLPNDVEPSMPPEIGLLTALKIFGVLFGEISAKLSDILLPDLLGLPSLAQLSLQSSGVSGTIPEKIGQMTGLRTLAIGANKLTGSLPNSITKMTSLEHLIVNDMTGLIGTLPSELGLLTSLTGLEVTRDSLTGSLPTELGVVTNLRILACDDNFLTGSIPSEFGLITSNRKCSFDMRNNAMTGRIPSQLGLMTGTTTLGLGNRLDSEGSGNNFTGSIPTELWELSALKKLRLGNLPALRGRIPSDIMIAMPEFEELILSGSPHLIGTLPEEICSIDDLDFDCSDLLCGCDCPCQSHPSGNQSLPIPQVNGNQSLP